MPNNGLTPKTSRAVLDVLALRSLQWKDRDKFSFLWDGEVVLAHVDHSRNFFFVVSTHTVEIKESIYKWLWDRQEFIWEVSSTELPE